MNDKKNIGRMASKHFKGFWAVKNPQYLPETKFIIGEEESKKIVVIDYPEAFSSEVFEIIDFFYNKKDDRIEKAEKEVERVSQEKAAAGIKRKRKRIPLNNKTP